jgi:hypothetical protein
MLQKKDKYLTNYIRESQKHKSINDSSETQSPTLHLLPSQKLIDHTDLVKKHYEKIFPERSSISSHKEGLEQSIGSNHKIIDIASAPEQDMPCIHHQKFRGKKWESPYVKTRMMSNELTRQINLQK